MATTACTTSIYNTVVVGIANNTSGGTEIVTFQTPKPVWSETDYTDPSQVALQCGAVAIGGFNGLNS